MPYDFKKQFGNTLKAFFIRLAAAAFSILTVPAISFSGAAFALFIYNVTHAIPNPIERGEDLGNGFAALFGFAIGFVASLPLSAKIYSFASTKLASVIKPE